MINSKTIMFFLLIQASIIRVKCTAMLLTVYLKSNEITFEVKRPQKLPALESREKKRGGALGSGGGNGPADLAGNIAGGKWQLCKKLYISFILTSG